MHARPGSCPMSYVIGRRLAAISLTVAVLLAAGCSKATDASTPGSTPGAPGTAGRSGGSSTSAVPRPTGPAADLSEEITAPGTPFMGEGTPFEVPDYVQHEYIASGTATDYRAPALPPDGVWTFTPDTTAAYRTRIVVRRPADPKRFSGTVVVEWLNVSGGLDANPDYASTVEEITRKGHAWVGVSAQLIGVSGGPVLVSAPGAEGIVGKGLKALDPARYATLDHPGDGYSFDIYTQIARALRTGGPVLGDGRADVLLAAGESQSAIALTTYYNGVQPLTKAFDGFLIHSRAFAPLPLVAPGRYADLAGSMTTTPAPVLLRGDLEAPVLEVQAEGDVIGILNSVAARQPDTDRFRLWEVAGTAHADAHLVGFIAQGLDCGAPINNGAMHFVVKAGLRSLDTWVRTGDAPPEAPRLEVTGDAKPAIRRDSDGIAVGGIRTPVVDVPVDVLAGDPPPSPDLICILMGSTTPLPAARLAERYPNRAVYEDRYRVATDAAITAGFVLEDDRAALVAYSQPSRVG